MGSTIGKKEEEERTQSQKGDESSQLIKSKPWFKFIFSQLFYLHAINEIVWHFYEYFLKKIVMPNSF